MWVFSHVRVSEWVSERASEWVSVNKQVRSACTALSTCYAIPYQFFWIRTEIRTLSSVQVLTVSKHLNKATKKKIETHSSLFKTTQHTLKSLFAVWRIFLYSTFYFLCFLLLSIIITAATGWPQKYRNRQSGSKSANHSARTWHFDPVDPSVVF